MTKLEKKGVIGVCGSRRVRAHHGEEGQAWKLEQDAEGSHLEKHAGSRGQTRNSQSLYPSDTVPLSRSHLVNLTGSPAGDQMFKCPIVWRHSHSNQYRANLFSNSSCIPIYLVHNCNLTQTPFLTKLHIFHLSSPVVAPSLSTWIRK